jgi:hypothetical protein
MRARKLFLLVLAYVAFDLADPVLPGAFSFEVKDSEVEEAIHVPARSGAEAGRRAAHAARARRAVS